MTSVFHTTDIKAPPLCEDFTTEEYLALLKLAKQKYPFQPFTHFHLSQPVVYWRHDCDFSLNRALRIAQIEYQEGISSTYFLNPHSEFYNLLEKSQTQIVKKIMAMGHKMGLHFDAAYYDIDSEKTLDCLIEKEGAWLSEWLNTSVEVFSFHNPTPFLLQCEQNHYGGLINTSSRFFKENTLYCSDSNGYWRYQSLRKVLEEPPLKSLQILTHADWWQETAMPPRDRVVRAVQGRADAVLNLYDEQLAMFGRKNIR